MTSNVFVVRETFLLVRVSNPAHLCSTLENYGIFVRNRDKLPGLSGYVRITIPNQETASEFLEKFLNHAHPSKIYVFDLDNTLYDTWPTLLKRPPRNHKIMFALKEVQRLLCLKAFKSIRLKFMLRVRRRNCEVMFLSARHKSTFIPTGLRLSLDMRTFVFWQAKVSY